jgi:hypothetical protein
VATIVLFQFEICASTDIGSRRRATPPRTISRRISLTRPSESLWSKITKRPSMSAARASSFNRARPKLWKVDMRIAPALRDPTRGTIRAAISRAALLVKLTATIAEGLTPRSISAAMRRVITRVLPLPAPARISIGPLPCSTASRCAAFSCSMDELRDQSTNSAGQFSTM